MAISKASDIKIGTKYRCVKHRGYMFHKKDMIAVIDGVDEDGQFVSVRTPSDTVRGYILMANLLNPNMFEQVEE